MNQKISILIGTNRKNSRTKIVAEYYSKILENQGIINEIIDIRNFCDGLDLNRLYDNGMEPNEFEKRIKPINKIIVIVPEYNGSYPGVLKCLLDGINHETVFNEKKIALVGLSSGVLGNAVGLGHLSDVLSYLGAHILGLRVKLGQIEKYVSENAVTNPVYEKFILQQIESFIKF